MSWTFEQEGLLKLSGGNTFLACVIFVNVYGKCLRECGVLPNF